MAGVSKEEYVVIVAGGIGTRLWPWSRKKQPKQFLRLFQGQTMLEQVYLRVQNIVPVANIFIVAPEEYSPLLSQYLPSFPSTNFLAEPTKKGTTAAYGYAAINIKQLNPDAIIHIIAADDYIVDIDRYQRSFSFSAHLVRTNSALVIYGVKPTDPNPGYGYIKVDLNTKATQNSVDAYRVIEFHEKPSRQVAQAYISDPSYFWHTFGFSVSVTKMLELIKVHDPATYVVMEQIEADLRQPSRLEQARLKEHYGNLQTSNIEEKILESEAPATYMVVLEETWSDVGTWDHVYNLKPKDQQGNLIIGDPNNVYTIGVSNSLIVTATKPLALVGVDNLVVVDTDDVTLICAKDRSQDIKQLVDLLKDKKVESLL